MPLLSYCSLNEVEVRVSENQNAISSKPPMGYTAGLKVAEGPIVVLLEILLRLVVDQFA